ncbi:HAD-IIIC family phosphatase [Actinoplanes sp. NPDC049265]|uniref:HAD-IIIC family phosphatase n=1 Tax=Actinoplanes sp. NPDC049265 TaxID=3363902 RepID=UPI00371CBA91
MTTIKCVVWDLDGTLWRGTLIEGDDVVLTPGVRRIVEELDHRGILQSVASKNDFEPAWSKVTEFGLAGYFLHPRIGWGDKSSAIRVIAERLNLALSTFAFVDDQQYERDEVRHTLPQVLAVDAADLGGLLDRPRLRPRFVTDESRMRRRTYQDDIRRNRAEEEFPGGREQFLAGLDTRVTIRPATGPDLRRAEELTVRTSQLNTTGRHYSYETLDVLKDSADHLLLVAELTDRYGDSGTVGLALIERTAGAWLIRLLVMSCRVLTRGIGGVLVGQILRSAKAHGVRVRAEFVPNERNRVMYLTYRFNGFREVSDRAGLVLLEHDLDRIRPVPGHVTVLPSGGL